MTVVQCWTGCETRALRQALRMSLREFAAHLGISERAVSKWEAGGARVTPRPDNQAVLDTALGRASADAVRRFHAFLSDLSRPNAPQHPVPQPPVYPDDLLLGVDGGGVDQERSTDGKRMALVPAGPFLSGPHNEPSTIAAFSIDVTPVTNSEYAQFTAATGHPAPRHWSHGAVPAEIADHPVVFVSYADASAYAIWAGKTLPSTEQWEKAARGPHGSRYPWGDQPTAAKCNVRESGPGCTTPVNRYHSGVSCYGVYDLSGNVWEWCATPTAPGRRTLRGSAFTSPFALADASTTNDADAGMSDDDTGFRCVAQA